MQRVEGMCRTTPNNARAFSVGNHLARAEAGSSGRRTEAGQHQRMVRRSQERPHDVLGEGVESRR